MSGLTQPLDLRTRLKAPSHRLDTVALVDVLVIALFFVVLDSDFLTPPGVSIALPASALTEQAGLPPVASVTVGSVLEKGGGREAAGTLPEVSVVNVKQADLAIFEGEITSVEALGRVMEAFLAREVPGYPVLLVKAGEDVSVQTLFDVMAAAQEAGFAQVRLAAEVEDGEAANTLNSDGAADNGRP